MSSSCNHDCANCKSNCASKEKQSLIEAQNKNSNVKKVVAVVSGKGGVGKSLVTSMMAVNFRRKGQNVAVLDADITGPSIPRIFGAHGDITGTDEGMIPFTTYTGIKLMSVNLLVDSESTPVIWRGSLISNTVKQFWTDVCWGEIDWMFVDMPPGTGDVPLTVFQSLPLDGIIIVASPQELVSMIVQKAVKMANMMNVPIYGIVENMSYVECPDCGKQIKIYGDSHIDEVAAEYGIPVLAKMPIDPKLAALCDDGDIEMMESKALDGAVNMILG